MKKIILLTALFIYYATLSYAQHAGDLDSSFGTNGIVTANLGSSYNYNFSVKKVLAQSDGSIYLIVIVSYNHVMIIKTHPNGSTDSSYGHSGFSIAGNIYATDALMQPDGKIVMVGGRNIILPLFVLIQTEAPIKHSVKTEGKLLTYQLTYQEAHLALALLMQQFSRTMEK